MLRRVKQALASPAMRLRLGILLWLVSWTPIAEIVGADAALRAAIWTVQVLIGIAGLALAGSTFVEAVKHVGWRRAPRVLWRGLVHGDPSVEAGASV